MIVLSILLLLLNQSITVSGWANTPKSISNNVNREIPHPSSIKMSAAPSESDGAGGGSLLVSNMYKIGLLTDESSKLRLVLASQSPRRREILVCTFSRDLFALYIIAILNMHFLLSHATKSRI